MSKTQKRRYVNWRWKLRNNEQGYIAASNIYHEALNQGRAEWYAEKLADQKADEIEAEEIN